MEVIVLDKDVLEAIVQANDDLRDRGKTANQGVRLMLTNKDDKQLFYGDVHPNVQYEYDTTDAGEYKLCVMLTEMAFRTKQSKIKTKVKFSAEFHRSKLTLLRLTTIKIRPENSQGKREGNFRWRRESR